MDNLSSPNSFLSSASETCTLKKNASKELLTVTGDGSRRAVIKSIMKNSRKSTTATRKLETEKVMRSALFSQLDDFLPKMKKANNDILMKTDEERREMDIENIVGCNKVVEMDVLLGQLEEQDSSSDDSEENIPLKLPRKRRHQTPPKKTPPQSLITEIRPAKDTLRSTTTPESEES